MKSITITIKAMEYINGEKIYNAIVRLMDETDRAEKDNKFSTQEDTAFFAGKRSALEELRDLVAMEYDKEDVDGEYRKAYSDYLGNELGYKCTPPTCSDCLFFAACRETKADGVCSDFADHWARRSNPKEADGKIDAQKPAERSNDERTIVQWPNLSNCKHDCKTCFARCLYRKEQNEEQKSAEWSEDYREEDLRTRFAFYTYKDEDGVLYLSNVFVEETSRNKGFGTKILAAAEKVAETIGAIRICLKVKQDSPANAWYRKNGYGYVAFEGDYDWLEKTLEYLKPSKQEWSKEDEDTYNRVYNLFRDAIDEWYKAVFSGCYPKITRDKVLAMLKSLRPQPRWKPSEEQPEVDIKKELYAYISSEEYINTREDGSLLIAKYFYELGLNARKEESHE